MSNPKDNLYVNETAPKDNLKVNAAESIPAFSENNGESMQPTENTPIGFTAMDEEEKQIRESFEAACWNAEAQAHELSPTSQRIGYLLGIIDKLRNRETTHNTAPNGDGLGKIKLPFDSDLAESAWHKNTPYLCSKWCVHSFVEGARWQHGQDTEHLALTLTTDRSIVIPAEGQSISDFKYVPSESERIAELEQMLKGVSQTFDGYSLDLSQVNHSCYKDEMIRKLEAKLAVATEALKWIAEEDDYDHCISEAKDALEEIEK